MASLTVMVSFKPVWVAPSSCWYPASLSIWPHSLHQLIKHGRLHPEVVEEGLWASSTLSSSISLAQCPYSLLHSSASNGRVWYFLGLLLLFLFLAFSTSLSSRSCWRTAIWSKATSSRGPYFIAVVLRLMKMLDSASFYTRLEHIPAIFLIHLRHLLYSKYIRSTF